MKNLVLLVCLLVSTSVLGQKTDHVVTINTAFGNMIAILYDETPKHKENFIKLAKEHFFDSLLFHRVIEGFMIQGGDPESKHAKPGERLGNGGPGYTVDAEFNPKFFHEKGALSAARLGDPVNPSKASSGSQFYIVHGKKISQAELTTDFQQFSKALQQFVQKEENKKYYDTLVQLQRSNDKVAYEKYMQKFKGIVERSTGMKIDKDISPEAITAYTTIGGAPHLDGQYTVFGKIIKGLEVIDSIASQPVDRTHRPIEDIPMHISVMELPRKKIEKIYGYTYPEIKK